MADAKKKTKKEIVEKAFPEGKKINLKDRVEVEILVEKNGFQKGQKVMVHPTTADQFVEMNVAKKL